jgi:cystathionine beta-lyase
MWVADMDFQTAPAVLDAFGIKYRAYIWLFQVTEEWYQSIISGGTGGMLWMQRNGLFSVPEFVRR